MNSKWKLGWLAGVVLLAPSVGYGRDRVPDEKPPTDVPAADLKAVADGNNSFAIDLYKKLAEKETGNILFSPYSISSALAMTYAGARGETAEQMAKTLHFALPPERLHSAFGAMNHHLQDGDDKPFELTVANALWGQKGFPFRPEFLDLTRKNYAGGFREVDFIADPTAARQTVNRWVAQKTQGRIKELLYPNDVTSNTRLVLTNAIYFKAARETPFLRSETKDAPFEIAPDQKVMVPMMQTQKASFKYFASDDGEWLELPYTGGRLSMVVLLPPKGQLVAVEKRLTTATIQASIAKLGLHRGVVVLPRFKMSGAARLKDQLCRMGMPAAFTNDADFSGMTGRPELAIGDVIHEAWLKTDEFGSEAAAATAVTMAVIDPRPFSFCADRPFVFLIRDTQMGNILFWGRVIRPAK